MPINLSIKAVPDHVAAKLKARAARHRRSLQKEVLCILEQVVDGAERLTAGDVLKQVRTQGLRTASEAVAMLRADRDAR